MPDLWVSSAAKRTEETCKRVLRASAVEKEFALDKSLYLATAGEIIKYISHVSDDANSLLIVGHNPGVAELVMKLCSSGEPEAVEVLKSGYPPATFCKITLDIEHWSQIEPYKGYLKAVLLAK